jgi:outer membrane protein assembly factor BamB
MPHCHAPKLRLAVVFLSIGVFTLSARGQPPDRPPSGAPAPPPPGEPVTLPQDIQARQRLAAADDYIRVRAWPEAVRLLQVLLDARADSFRRVTYRDKRGRTSQRWASIRVEAEQLLAHLPKEGMDFYRLTYEARARQELAAAKRDADRAAIQEVARRYRRTAAGVEALEWLGSYHLDRGQADLAAVCYRQLLRDPGPDRLAPLTLFKAALAERLTPSGEKRATEAMSKLVERVGEGGLRLGVETYSAEKIRALLDRWPGAANDDSLLYRGDATRSASGRGEGFSLEAQWRIPTVDETVARQWLLRGPPPPMRTILPAAAPLALDGKIVYRDAGGLSACDVRSGKQIWHNPSPLSLASVLADSGKKVQLQDWFRRYGWTSLPLVENSTLGTLSSDGRRVYAVEDLPFPPHPEQLQNDNGVPAPLGAMRYFVGHNRLRALDATTGKLVWTIGGATATPPGRKPAAKTDDPLTDAHFLGAPLPLGGQLFVLVEKQQELRLVCLDAERGTVRWTQMLATAHEKMLVDVVRRTQAAHLAYADGVLVCPTQSGAVLGVDPLTHSLVWAYVYASTASTASPREEGPNPTPFPRLFARWKSAAPIVHAGRIILTPSDGDEILCLRLHDGSLVWKAPRSTGDLFIGCVHKDRVLVVGETACRALSLDTGETLWRRASEVPSGQGVAAGPLYYLPLKGGAILALNLERPEESVRLDARSFRGDLGNLVFHRGVLWSQSATELIALTPLRTQLARLEQRLARSPRDPSLLSERGRLRLEGGDVSGAAADLHDALAHDPPNALRSAIRARFFAALTQLLQSDFAAGEKYLAEYRALCRPAIPASASAERRRTMENERRRRSMHYLALVAAGRAKQGRVLDALAAYRELSREAPELMPSPDDPAVQTRPDRWVAHRVAVLFRRATPPQRQLLSQEIRREWQVLDTQAHSTSLRRFLALFGEIEGEEASLMQEARLRLATQQARAAGRSHALEAELLLARLQPRDASQGPASVQTRALFEHAMLMTRRGLLPESVADYRRLAREFPTTVVQDGQTGAQLLDGLRMDKRFLAELEPASDPWEKRPLRVDVLTRGRPVAPLRLPCVPCRLMKQGEMNAPEAAIGSSYDLVRELPAWCRPLRFTLDGARLQLQVSDRASGTELYSIPLPLTGLPPTLRDGEVYFQAVDHLLVLCVGTKLLGVDLLARRVRWSWNVVEGPLSPSQPVISLTDGGMMLNLNDPRSPRRLGLIGPIGRSVVCVQTPNGLAALDPASGDVCWRRSDAPHTLAVFGDDDYLFLVDQSGDGEVRGVRALRARDGEVVSTLGTSLLYANQRSILGRLLIVEEPGADEQRIVRLYDPLSGKDLWRRTMRPDAFLLKSPSPGWLGIVEPSGAVAVIELTRGEEVARLHLDPRHLAKVHDGHLLMDRERFFIALHGPMDPEWKIVDEPSGNFRSGLPAVHVCGMLYAFGRDRGELRWFTWLPPQMLLLDSFEELPIVLCSAVTARVNPADPGNTVAVASTRSIDKRTGKVLFNREAIAGDPFHTLHIDRRDGTIDLVSVNQIVRHMPRAHKP